MKIPFDWAVFLAALLVAVSGELACFARTAALVARYGSPLSVVLGTLLGNLVILVPVLLFGAVLHRYLPHDPVRIGAGLLFVVLGVLMMLDKFH
jgi:putative Ca2+/H+ antiporter (TMEM165/GDT1 family)